MLIGIDAKLHTVVCISAILEGSLGDVATISKGRGLCQECRNYEWHQNVMLGISRRSCDVMLNFASFVI